MISENYQNICETIDRTSSLNGIGQTVTVVAVTKNQPESVIPDLAALGVSHFAENRVQALFERAPLMPGTRHLIGHLQTNKVRHALLCADLIQSVDSLHLATEIDRCAANLNRVQDILIQVNIAKEPQKFGIAEEDLSDLLHAVSAFSHTRIRGLMAIMPIETKEEYYRKMYDLYCNYSENKLYNVSMDYLSMGMSNDYELAVYCGANMVRIGRALYQSTGKDVSNGII